MGFEKIFDIIERFVPGRMEQYRAELDDLAFKYQKAMEAGKDTEASIIRKKLKLLRRKLGIKDD